jgi:hypothetical protein
MQMRWIRIAALGLALVSCGDSPTWRDIARKCVSPRTGIDPATGQPYDKQGTLDDEKAWLRAWSVDTYFWYNELPSPDPKQYSSATDYFDALRTSAKTPSGNPKDRFHFWYSTAEWQQISSGVEVGYGIKLAAFHTSPPREYYVGYLQPGSPADGPLKRGAFIKTVDGVDLVNATGDANRNVLDAGLFPATVGEQHTFEVIDVGQSTPRSVTLTSAAVSVDPVPPALVQTIPTANGGMVGYMLFNDHNEPSEQALVNAFNTLKSQGAKDLVLDLRYNGGGYLAIASQTAFMIAGSARTSGKTFEQLKFNQKYPSTDPITLRAISPTPFYNQTVGFSTAAGAALPTLNLPRVIVLTGTGTCSASESILNSLSGIDVQVIQIGDHTCGKPYGFYPEDNCGVTYFSIQFKGVNAKGFGDYADGFYPAPVAPAVGFGGCSVADDFSHALGDPAEARLAAALSYSVSGSCGSTVVARALVSSSEGGPDDLALKSRWRENRILGLPRRQ